MTKLIQIDKWHGKSQDALTQTRVKRVTIHTDGGCEGNPGPGGWAALLSYGGRTREISGSEPATTNNRMELTAAIEALQALKEPCQVRLVTDSEYLREGITKWLAGWKAKGWMKTLKKTVRNDDLWRALDQAAAQHAIQWEWVQGHSGHAENERCDQLAQAEVASIKQRFSVVELERLLDQFRASHSAQKDQPSLL